MKLFCSVLFCLGQFGIMDDGKSFIFDHGYGGPRLSMNEGKESRHSEWSTGKGLCRRLYCGFTRASTTD